MANLRKKEKKEDDVSMLKETKKKKKSHSCSSILVLSFDLFSFILAYPSLLIIITKLCACDVMGTGLLFTTEVRRLYF